MSPRADGDHADEGRADEHVDPTAPPAPDPDRDPGPDLDGDLDGDPDLDGDLESDRAVGPDDEHPPPGPATRIMVFVAATVAVLLVGATIGMLITMSRVDSASPPSPDSVDVGFAQDMRVHHLQAVTMSGIARDRTTDGEVRGLAFDIESTQLAQASRMAGWLTVWGRPDLPDPGAGHMEWMSEGGTHQHSDGQGETTTGAVDRMPGMATTEELNELRAASGRELDVLFLQLMLRHHQGGLEMAQYGAEHAREGYVRNLAEKIVQSQQAEVDLMTAMLARRGAKPLPPP